MVVGFQWNQKSRSCRRGLILAKSPTIRRHIRARSHPSALSKPESLDRESCEPQVEIELPAGSMDVLCRCSQRWNWIEPLDRTSDRSDLEYSPWYHVVPYAFRGDADGGKAKPRKVGTHSKGGRYEGRRRSCRKSG